MPWTEGGNLWGRGSHGQLQTVGSTLALENALEQKEETLQGYRAPRPLQVRFLKKKNGIRCYEDVLSQKTRAGPLQSSPARPRPFQACSRCPSQNIFWQKEAGDDAGQS